MKLPKDLDPFVIGLWRFRQAGEEPGWCCTFCPEIDPVLARLLRKGRIV